jgi:CRISPR-associated protein (TIGR03984 family)
MSNENMARTVVEHVKQMGVCVAIVLSPERAYFARSGVHDADAGLVESADIRIDPGQLERAFDVTLFNDDEQVRVWMDGGVVCSSTIKCGQECASRPDGYQRIWGRIIESAPPDRYHWTQTWEARIGVLDVPVTAGDATGDHLAFVVHECWGEDEHGNVTVSATRLRGIVHVRTGGERDDV